MSKVTDEKAKKTYKMGSFNVNVELDGKMFEAVTVEGTDPRQAFERFLRNYLVFRSVYFPGLIFDDVEHVLEEIEDLDYNETETPFVVGKHQVEVPIKNEGEVTGHQILTATFFKRRII